MKEYNILFLIKYNKNFIFILLYMPFHLYTQIMKNLGFMDWSVKPGKKARET